MAEDEQQEAVAGFLQNQWNGDARWWDDRWKRREVVESSLQTTQSTVSLFLFLASSTL